MPESIRSRPRLGRPNVTLEFPGGENLPAELSAVDAEGAEVHLDAATTPRVALRQDLVLVVDSKHGTHRVPGMVVRRDDRSGEIHYGLWFCDPEEVERAVLPYLEPLLNRRVSSRVAPPAITVVEVQLLDAEGEGEVEVAGELVDICAQGLGVRLDPHAADPLSNATRVFARFRLPEWREEAEFPARIRHRRLEGGVVHYGVEFDAESAVARPEEVEAIRDYVRRRQGEALRRVPPAA